MTEHEMRKAFEVFVKDPNQYLDGTFVEYPQFYLAMERLARHMWQAALSRPAQQEATRAQPQAMGVDEGKLWSAIRKILDHCVGRMETLQSYEEKQRWLDEYARNIVDLRTQPAPADAVDCEALAAIEHEQWMYWAKDILTKESISAERKERWVRLFVPYHELSGEMKEHDRVWARKVQASLTQRGGKGEA